MKFVKNIYNFRKLTKIKQNAWKVKKSQNAGKLTQIYKTTCKIDQNFVKWS